MTGVIVCHTSPAVREHLVVASIGVPSLAPVRAATTSDDLVALARRLPPTMALVDARLPGAGAPDAVRRLRAVVPATAVVLIASPDDVVALDRALALGARGFLAPDVGRAELAAVAAHVQASALPPTGNARLASRPGEGRGGDDRRADDEFVVTGAAPFDLTKREVQVLAGMSNGHSNGEIGRELYLSEDTVKTHARRLFHKLAANDRAQAVAIGLRLGIIR